MTTASDDANARETTRMVARYADSIDITTMVQADITPIRWVAYLSGKSTMTLPVLQAVARVLGLSLGQLLAKAEGRRRG